MSGNISSSPTVVFSSSASKSLNSVPNTEEIEENRLSAGAIRREVSGTYLPQGTFKERLWSYFFTEDGKNVSIALILNNIKIVLLVLVWVFMVILLAIKQKHEEDNHMVTVDPGAARDFPVPKERIDEQIGVVCSGPFKLDNKAEGEKPDMLEIQFKQNTKTVSDVFRIYLRKGNYEEIDNSETDHAFQIHKDLLEDNGNNMLLSFSSNLDKPVTVKLRFDRYPVERKAGLIYGTIVLILLYGMIVSEIIDRTFASVYCATLALAILMTLNNRIDLVTIMNWVDVETLLLLFGMMILVALYSDSGIFDYFAVKAYEISRGHVWPLINSLCFFTAILSAFLDNVTMMLLIAPIIIKLCEALVLDPVMVLTFMVIYSNIGAACTPIGDPPNIIITTNEFIATHGINFGNFMLHTLPCVALVLLQTYIQLHLMLKKKVTEGLTPEQDMQTKLKHEKDVWNRITKTVTPNNRTDFENILQALKSKVQLSAPAPGYEDILKNLKLNYGIRNKPLLIKASVAFGFVMTLFLLHSFHDLHHLSLGWAALIGAIMLMVIVEIDDFSALLLRIEWSTLIFFTALFIFMEVMSKLGLIAVIGNGVIDMIMLAEEQYRLLIAILLVLWVSAITSAFLDNIPVTAMMVRIIITLSQDRQLQLPLQPLVWTLAMGACFGGNGTLIAASANVVSAGIAQQHGYKFTFMQFFVVGFPVMIGNIIVTTLYMLFAHVLFEWHPPPQYDY